MKAVLEKLKSQLEMLLDDISDMEIDHADHLSSLDAHRKMSAVNFLHYNAVRQHDLRELQRDLTLNGFSSLGGCEASVKSSIYSVLNLIHMLLGEVPNPIFLDIENREQGDMLLNENYRRLFGDRDNAYPGVMVTMPTEAAFNKSFIKNCLLNGMTCMRVNCSHDTPKEWYQMISNLRALTVGLNLPCKVLMDLPGPKLRTGRVVSDVIKIKPTRDRYGKILSHAQFLISDKDLQSDLPYVKVSKKELKEIQLGDYFHFEDSRGASRKIKISRLVEGAFLGECIKTAYINKKVIFRRERKGFAFQVKFLCATDPYLFFRQGDSFYLTSEEAPDRMIKLAGERLPAIRCTCPDVFKFLKDGEKIFFDDGKIEGRIRKVYSGYLIVDVVRTVPKGSKLKADKGINLPDSKLDLPPLGANDVELIKFISKYADIIGYSFVQKAQNVKELFQILQNSGGTHLGIILRHFRI